MNKVKSFIIIVILFSIIFPIYLFSFKLTSVNSKNYPDNIQARLILNEDSNWGNDAVGFNSIDPYEFVYIPQVAVIDTGCNITSDKINQSYIIDDFDSIFDNCNHGSVIISKLLELSLNINIIPIKVTDSENISPENLLKGLEKAILLNPDIISISIGTNTNYPEIEQAIKKAVDMNIVVVASAGNQGHDDLLFPARYDGVISVLARDINNLDISLNCKSESKRSFSAPGKNILVDNESITGSSIAVPYVTATISQMISISGHGKLTIRDVENILSKTSIYPTKYSYGLIQYDKAIKEVLKKFY